MRTASLILAATAAAPLAAAKRYLQEPLIDPAEARPLSELPIRVSNSGRNGFVHVQFPIECAKCFAADPKKPTKNLQDGFLEIDFRITRQLGLDGDDGAQVNGFSVSDSTFPFSSPADANIASAVRLFVTGEDGGPAIVPVQGNLAFDTILANGTHDVKGVSYNITRVGAVAPAAPAGFRLSYTRAPKNTILRIEQGAGPVEGEAHLFQHPAAWASSEPSGHFAWKRTLDWMNAGHAALYPGWDQDFVRCETIACRVNKLHTRVTRAYSGCVERVEHPEKFESGAVPPGCYALLAPYYARRNFTWVACGLLAILSSYLRTNVENKKKQAEKVKQQQDLDEQMLERLEDDAVSYLMEVEAKNVEPAASSNQKTQENATSRKAFKGADEE